MKLEEKIREFIHKQSEPVALQSLLKLGTARGIPTVTMLEAMRKVHRFKDIRTRNRMGTVYYDPMPIHEVVSAPRVSRTDYPVMDETNDCHHEIFKDMDYQYLFMTPEEIRVLEYTVKRQREKDTLEYLKGH